MSHRRALHLACFVWLLWVTLPAVAAQGGQSPAGLGADDTQAPARFAAILYAWPLEGLEPSTAETMVDLHDLLADPMVGKFRLSEVNISGDISAESIKEALFPEGAAGRDAAVSFYYFFGGAGDALSKVIANKADFVSALTGRTKIVVIDDTKSLPAREAEDPLAGDGTETAEPGDGLACLRVDSSQEESGASVTFTFTGTTGPDHTGAKVIVEALRNCDENRDRVITIGEFTDFVSGKTRLESPVDLGEAGAARLLKYLTFEEFAEAHKADEVLVQAGEYARQQRWVRALLLLREIKDEKYTSPEYRAISENAQLNLSLEARYSKDSGDENTGRSVSDGLDFIRHMLLLADVNYVEDVDNRDLFEGGVKNLGLLLENRRATKKVLPPETMGMKAQFLNFLEETKQHVYQKSALSISDFRTRIERILMENKGTVDLPDGVVITEFIYGIADALDPNTGFIPRHAYREFQDDTAGHFGGLGIEITLEDSILTVVTPLDGTPAAEAGLLPGDRIIAIEGESTEGMNLMEAVRRLRGPLGTSVTISVVHRSSPDPVEVKITRGNIVLESVKGYNVDPESGQWQYVLDEADRIGYVRLTDFKEDTAGDLDRAIGVLRDKGMQGLVLDLRFNHGGLLTSGVSVADRFLSQGTIVTVKGTHTRARPWRAHYFRTYESFPVVILVNEQTASAAEILAGALKDHSRAILVGTRTFGKGTVQTVYPLGGGLAAFKLTTGKYYTPSGVCIHREPYSDEGGLTPDREVTMTTEDEGKLVEVWHLRGLKREARERLIARQQELSDDALDVGVTDPDTFEDPQVKEALRILRSKIQAKASDEKDVAVHH
ncbi:MAG: S41 family peptidase [Planctomycetes bacterium]|nr:S41 family peptidase [Planctomycetota bacterium]